MQITDDIDKFIHYITDDIDKFIQNHKLPKLMQEETENLNRDITKD